MGRARAGTVIEPRLKNFAARLRDEAGANRVLLFGSRARGDARQDSDYDVVVISEGFRGVAEVTRPVRLYRLFYDSGIHAPVDLFCLTPDEFDYASTHITLINAVLPEAIDLLDDADSIPLDRSRRASTARQDPRGSR